eukprot:6177888-Pleurochrysis_carterae.AAC.1
MRASVHRVAAWIVTCSVKAAASEVAQSARGCAPSPSPDQVHKVGFIRSLAPTRAFSSLSRPAHACRHILAQHFQTGRSFGIRDERRENAWIFVCHLIRRQAVHVCFAFTNEVHGKPAKEQRGSSDRQGSAGTERARMEMAAASATATAAATAAAAESALSLL